MKRSAVPVLRGVSLDVAPVAMVFQYYALYPHMTVAENLSVPLRMRQMTFAQRFPVLGRIMPQARRLQAEIERKATSVAEALRIEHLLDRKPSQLSGGQHQRVAVMLDGELLQGAPPTRIYGDPEDRRVAELVGSPKISMI